MSLDLKNWKKETRNYLIEEIKHNDLKIEKYKKTYKYLNYAEHLVVLASKITSCVLISALTTLAVGITSSTVKVRLKICVITAGIKKYKSVIKKKKKKHNEIVLLGKAKLNT